MSQALNVPASEAHIPQHGPPPGQARRVPPPSGATSDCPILCWMLSLNREYSREEYEACYELVKECVPHARIEHKPEDPDTFRALVSQMLPLLMMRHRRIPRYKWRDNITANGKHWIEQLPEEVSSDKYQFSMIGYHLHFEASICGMAMVQGLQRKVVNIGLGIKQCTVEPKHVTVAEFAESLQHKLTPMEFQSIHANNAADDDILRRLSSLIALKDAYIRAIGQPLGFDYSRLEFDIPKGTAHGDKVPLQGWEFRVWTSYLGVARRDKIVDEKYMCAIAFFRGSTESKFIWYDNPRNLETWVQYINIDQIIKVVSKLNA